MVNGLLDASIIIDILRGYEPAIQWSKANDLRLGTTYYVWLECFYGVTDKQELTKVLRFLNLIDLVPVTVEDVEWATKQLSSITLRFNRIDPIDTLIASTSARLKIPLFTRNMKHMNPLLGTLAVKPY